jgi:hypothetical protein
MPFYPAACYLIPLMSKYLHLHCVLEYFQSNVYPLCERPHLTPYEMTRKITFFKILILIFLDKRWED